MTQFDDVDEAFSEWCLVELMGHRRLAGLVTSVELAGKGFLRVDLFGKPEPNEKPKLTQFISPQSVYALTPITEVTARRFAHRSSPAPITRYEVPAIEAPETEDAETVPDDYWVCPGCQTKVNVVVDNCPVCEPF